MPVNNRSGGGGATWQGWKENAKGIVTTQNIAKFDPVVLGIYGDFETAIDKVSDGYVTFPDLNVISDGPTGFDVIRELVWLNDNILIGTNRPTVTILKRGAIEDTFEPDYSNMPFLYEVDGTTMAKFTCMGMAKTKDGKYIAVSGGYSTYSSHFFLVKVNEDGSFTQIDLTTLFASCDYPFNMYNDTYKPMYMVWSPDGQYLAFLANGYVHVFKRVGDVFTKRVAYLSFSSNAAGSIAFAPDGSYLIVGTYDSPYYKYYSFDAVLETFTAATPFGVPSYSASRHFYETAISPDGKYVVFGDSLSPYLYIFVNNNGVYTKLANPAVLPGAAFSAYSTMFFDEAGKYLIMTLAAAPFIAIYEVDAATDTFTKLANPSTLPPLLPLGCALSDDGKNLAITFNTEPYIYFYRTESKNAVSKVTHFSLNPLSWIPQNNNLGIALQAGAIGEEIKINLFPKLNNMIE